MKKIEKQYLDVLENHGWAVSSYTDDGRVELEKYSPAGEDFSICVGVENLPAEVREYAAGFDIDLTPEGDDWHNIIDSSTDRKPIRVSVSDDGISLITDGEAEADFSGNCWEDVSINCESEQLKELALFPGEPEAYFYVDSTDGEYFPFRGGRWSHGANAGVFYTYLHYSRASVSLSVGFRSAYFKKN